MCSLFLLFKICPIPPPPTHCHAITLAASPFPLLPFPRSCPHMSLNFIQAPPSPAEGQPPQPGRPTQQDKPDDMLTSHATTALVSPLPHIQLPSITPSKSKTQRKRNTKIQKGQKHSTHQQRQGHHHYHSPISSLQKRNSFHCCFPFSHGPRRVINRWQLYIISATASTFCRTRRRQANRKQRHTRGRGPGPRAPEKGGKEGGREGRRGGEEDVFTSSVVF